MRSLRVFVFLLFFVVLAAMAFAQETPEGVVVEPTVLSAILVLVGGGVVTTITGLIKTLLKASGILAVIINGLVAVGATAVYFLILNPPFNLPKFILYAVVVFGEATGYYHFYKTQKTG